MLSAVESHNREDVQDGETVQSLRPYESKPVCSASRGGMNGSEPVLGVAAVLILAACVGPPDSEPLGDRLSSDASAVCGSTSYWTQGADSTSFDQSGARDLTLAMGYALGDGLNALGPHEALTLCALAEPPLEAGDNVIRILRLPSFPWMGPAYVVRIERRHERTELTSRTAICQHDSLLALADRTFDEETGDSIFYLPDAQGPGSVGNESRRPVPRRLFDDALRYLEETGFWESEGHIPGIDGYTSYVEVQTGVDP